MSTKSMTLTKNASVLCDLRYFQPGETWPKLARRIASTVAAVEKTPELQKKWEEEFYTGIATGEFVPATPFLMNAGLTNTLFSCFVLPVDDSLQSIMKTAGDAAKIFQGAGGVGYSFSSLRPAGSPVASNSKGEASGPVSFMKIYNTTCSVLKQGGSRKGAQMGVLDISHPDIEEFINVKQDLTQLTNFNISVNITDAFMTAVENDDDWVLRFDRVNKTKVVSARALWNQIIHNAWKTGDPGLLFLERANEIDPMGGISATNPCVTKDTWVSTSDGPRQVRDLIGQPFKAMVDGKEYPSISKGFFKTGEKQICTIETVEGFTVDVTLDHLIKKVVSKTRHKTQTAWVKAKDLVIGDKVVIHDHRGWNNWSGTKTKEEGYLLGLLIGDGQLKEDKAILSSWDVSIRNNSKSSGVASMMAEAETAIKTLPHRSDFKGWQNMIQPRCEQRMSSAALMSLAKEMGLERNYKTITTQMEKESRDFNIGLLRGLFDADGSVMGSQEKGVSVRLAQIDLGLLQSVQRILARLGIVSTIYQNRKSEGQTSLPNGHGGTSLYPTKALHELVISRENLKRYSNLIGFADSDKQAKLTSALVNYKRSLNSEDFLCTISEVVKPGVEEEVYDATIDTIHAFDVNGFYVHNCSEQPLPPYACCNLGSIDVSKLIKNGELDTARYEWLIRVFIRFLDNAIEVNKYSLKEIEERQKAERRVGIGVMGVADALIKLGLPYDSERGRGWCESIASELKSASWQASADLAKEKGAFPWFKKSKLNGGTPVRNATCTTIAPTGSISIVAGCSSGIEPIYAIAFTRRHDLKGNEELTEVNQTFFEVAKSKGFYSDRLLKRIIENKGSCQGLSEVPKDVQDVFKTAIDISPRDHINMLISWQKHIDTGVSKTINLPSTATEKDVEEAYLQAYRGKCKGVTVFRDGCRGTQVLSTGPTEVKGRPDAIKGVTYKVETALGTMFTTINEVEEGKPFEVFAVLSKGGSNAAADSEAIGRLVSLALRGGISVEKIVSQIKGIGGGSAAFNKGRVITSIPDAVAYVLEKAYLDEKVEHPDDTAKYFPSGTEQMPYCKDCD